MKVKLRDRFTALVLLFTFIMTSVISFVPQFEEEAEASDVAFWYIVVNPGIAIWNDGKNMFRDNFEGRNREAMGTSCNGVHMQSYYEDLANYSIYQIIDTYDVCASGGTNGQFPNPKDPNRSGITIENVKGPDGQAKGVHAMNAFRNGILGNWQGTPSRSRSGDKLILNGTISFSQDAFNDGTPAQACEAYTSAIIVMKHDNFNAGSGQWGSGGGSAPEEPDPEEPDRSCEVSHNMVYAESYPSSYEGSYKDLKNGEVTLQISAQDDAWSTLDHDINYVWSIASPNMVNWAPSGWKYNDPALIEYDYRGFSGISRGYDADDGEDGSHITVNAKFRITPDMAKGGSIYMNVWCGPNCAQYDSTARADYLSITVPVSFGNKPPTAIGNVKDDKGLVRDFYRGKYINFNDTSTDPENDLMDRIYVLRFVEGGKYRDIATIKGTRSSGTGTWTYKTTGVDNGYIQEIEPNQNGFRFIVSKLGHYSIYQKVGDVNNMSSVTQLWDDNYRPGQGSGDNKQTEIEFDVNRDPAPPVADFDYVAEGKVVTNSFVGVPVQLKDNSTDPDGDIITYVWDPKYTIPRDGVMTKGNLNTKDSTITPNTLGTIVTVHTVTDETGFTDTIRKTLKIIPPIPIPDVRIPDPNKPDNPGGDDGKGKEVTDGRTYNEYWMKENRMVVFDLSNSLDPSVSKINWNQTEWTVTKDGNPADDLVAFVDSSDKKKRSYIFRKQGTYVISVKLHNPYMAAHPEEDSSASEISFRVKIAEDKAPVAAIDITGNSANFKDNPNKTSVKLKDSSSSKDADYIKNDIKLVPDNTNDTAFGRGKNAYDWKVILDANDDGKFDLDNGDILVFDTRDGSSEFNFDVPFAADTKGKYRAFFTVRETFGQKTLAQYVTDDDRRIHSITKDFTVNWVPDISYQLSDEPIWQGDDYSFTTNIKDERPGKTSTEWWVEELTVGPDYCWMHESKNCAIPPDIFDALPNLPTGEKDVTGTEYLVGTYYRYPLDTPHETRWDNVIKGQPNKDGGTIQFLKSGKYRIHCRITDEVGQQSEYYDDIRVLPRPEASIVDDPDLDWQSERWTAKQNRLFGMTGSGTVHDYYLDFLWWSFPEIYDKPVAGVGTELTEGSGYLEIIPLEGQPLDGNIYVIDKNTGKDLVTESEDYYIRHNMPSDMQVMFKYTGKYKVRWKMYNNAGKDSPYADATIIVKPDIEPIISMKVNDSYNRDPENSNISTILLYDIDLKSQDADTMVDTEIKYRFDSNNDGNYDDETWQPVTNLEIDEETKLGTASFGVTHVGKYQISIYSREEFGQPTIEKYINPEDHLDGTVVLETMVDNFAPRVDLSSQRGHKVDVVVAVGQVPADKISNLNNKVNTYIKNLLSANGASVVDSNIQMVETSSSNLADQNMSEILTKWQSAGSGTSWSYQSSINGINATNGCSSSAYFSNMKETKFKQGELKYKIRFNADNNCASHGEVVGSLINVNNVGDSYYSIAITRQPRAYQVYAKDGSSLGSITPPANSISVIRVQGSGITNLGSGSFSFTDHVFYDVSCKSNGAGKITVSINGSKIVEVSDTSPLEGEDIALFFNSHDSCDFANLGVETTNQKNLSDVLQGEVTWREGATKVVLNIDDMVLVEQYIENVPHYTTIGKNVGPGTWVHHGAGCTYAGETHRIGDAGCYYSMSDNCPVCTHGLNCGGVGNSVKSLPYGGTFDVTTVSYTQELRERYISQPPSQQEITRLSALLAASDINYVGLGNSYSVSINNTLSSAAPNGTFFYNDAPNMDTALRNAGNWILNLLNGKNMGDVHYILLNELISYNKIYLDYENDPQYTPYSKWYYEHDPDYFENSMGIHDKAGQWLDNSINAFDRVGYYQVTWQTKDNPVGTDERFAEYRKLSSMINGPLNLYVHRKPIADFTARIVKNASQFDVTLENFSYDIDHESEPGKGIAEVKWSWKNVNDSTWTEGLRTNFPTTQEFLIKLEVRDIDGPDGKGVWSEPKVIFISTSPQPPVAHFTLSPNQYPIGTDINIIDSSFDPNGDPIVEHRWELYFKGTKMTSFIKTNGSGVTKEQVNEVRDAVKQYIEDRGHSGYGEWKLTLQVRDNTGSWGDKKATSDVYSQTFTVKPNNRPPVITIDTGDGGAVRSDDDTYTDGADPNQIGDAQAIGYKRNVYVDAITTDGAVTQSPFLSWRNYLNVLFNPRLTVTDPDATSRFPNHDGFYYTWEFKNHASLRGILKGTVEMSDDDYITTTTMGPQYTTSGNHVPFTNSFKDNSLLPGPYELITTVRDKPLYGSSQSVSASLKFYIVPQLQGSINVIPYQDEIMVDENVKIRVVTDKWTEGVDVRLESTFNADNPYSNTPASADSIWTNIPFKEMSGNQYVFEGDYRIPEIPDSGDYFFTARLNTTAGSQDVYGEPNRVTRYKFVAQRHAVTALKVVDFYITDMVKHPEYEGLFPIYRPSMPANYTAGYYITVQATTKGKPENLIANVTINGSDAGQIEFVQVGEEGNLQIWESKYQSAPDLDKGSEINFEVIASRGSTTYNFNDKENWDGLTLIVTKSALEDVAINRTN